MNTFKDALGTTWALEIKAEDALRIRRMVTFEDGEPVDLLALSDTGKMYRVFESTRTMIDVVFACCLDQLAREFNVSAYDTEQAGVYAVLPDLAAETPFKKAQRWFAARVNGATLEGMLEAFKEAVLSFTPSRRQREALEAIWQSADRLEEAKMAHVQSVTAAAEKAELKEMAEKERKVGDLFGPTPESSD